MVFLLLHTGSWVHSSQIRILPLPSWKFAESKNGSAHPSPSTATLMIRFNAVRAVSHKVSLPSSEGRTPARICRWSRLSPPQISSCYLPNQWMPVRSSLIESLPLRSNRRTVNHRWGLMTLYCQIEMCMNCLRCRTNIWICSKWNETANEPIYQQVIRRSQ